LYISGLFDVIFRCFWAKNGIKNKKPTSFGCRFLWCAGRVRELTAAGGGYREADEGKTTSRQGCAQAAAVCADCFSGRTLSGSSPSLLQTKKAAQKICTAFYGALEGTRTPDPLIRSQGWECRFSFILLCFFKCCHNFCHT